MSGEPRKVGMGHLHDLMEVIQRNDAMLLVHSEDDDMVQHMYEKMAAGGAKRVVEYARWCTATNRRTFPSGGCMRVAEWAGSPVYFVHVSAHRGHQRHWRGAFQPRPAHLRRDAAQLLPASTPRTTRKSTG